MSTNKTETAGQGLTPAQSPTVDELYAALAPLVHTSHLGLKHFATSIGAAGWARENAKGPVTVLLEGIRKAPKAKRFELWLQQATLIVQPESVAFDVVPVRRLS